MAVKESPRFFRMQRKMPNNREPVGKKEASEIPDGKGLQKGEGKRSSECVDHNQQVVEGRVKR